MAPKKRARVDTSRLRAMGGVQRVVARPVDSYMRPTLQTNPQSEQLVDALATLNPAINRFISQQKEELKTNERELGEKSFYEATPEERKKLEKAIKAGEINETQSPFWVEGYTRSLLRNHANELGEDMILKWDTNKDKAGFDFDAFVAKERGDYIKKNGLDVFRADIFNDEFGDFTKKFEAQVRQRNFEHRLIKAREGRTNTMLGELDTVLSALDNSIDSGNFKAIDASKNVNSIIDTAIKQGNNPKVLLDAAVGYLRGKAIEIAGNGGYYEGVVEVLDKLKLKHGTYGITYKDDLENLKDTLETKREQHDDKDFDDEVEEKKKQGFELTEELLKGLTENKFSKAWFTSDETRKKIDQLRIIDATLGTSMLTDVENFYKDRGEIIQNGNIDTFNSLSTRIDNNENVREEILAAYKNKDINFAQKNALISANDGIYGQFTTNNGLRGIPELVANSVKQKASPLTGFLSDASKNRYAAEASSEMFTFINSLIPNVGTGKTYTIETAKELIFKKQSELEEKYRKLAEDEALKKLALQNTNPATNDDIKKWKSGDKYPWQNQDGSWNMSTDELADDYENLVRAIQTDPDNLGNFLKQTKLGKMLAPLVAAGEDINELLEVVTSEIVKENLRDKRTSVDKDGDGVVDAGTDLEGELVNGLSTVMKEFNLSPVLNLPESYEPTKVTKLLSEDNNFSGMYLYEDANGLRYITGEKPDKYNLGGSK